MPRGAAFGHAIDLWRSIRQEFDLYLEAEYERAAEACRDNLVNAEGRSRGITGVSLFMGPRRRAERWASEELLAYWRSHRRVTFAEFEYERVEAHYGGADRYPLTIKHDPEDVMVEAGW